jgi:hypothetical protein
MRKLNLTSSLGVLLVVTSFSAYAQDTAAIQKKLLSEYPLTQPTAANDDIVTAGAVLVLEKSNIMMAPVSSTNPYQNTYKNGKISQNAIGQSLKAVKLWNRLPGATQQNTPDTRTFVTGEKIWVTGIEVKPDGVVFDLFTDAISNGTADVRYKAALKFLFPKNSIPPPDQVDKLVAEVFKVQPADDAKSDAKQQAPAGEQQGAAANAQPVQSAAPQHSTETGPPPIAPPPPPPADPKTIALKQTTDEVVANFGQPDKIVKLGTKQIYVYKDMKVTFVNGKVTDVQ